MAPVRALKPYVATCSKAPVWRALKHRCGVLQSSECSCQCESVVFLLEYPTRLCQSLWKRAAVSHGIELAINRTQNLEFFLSVKVCSRAPIWVENAIPFYVRWAFRWPPADGSIVNLPHGHKPVKATLHVVVTERSRSFALSLSQPFLKHPAPKISGRLCVI